MVGSFRGSGSHPAAIATIFKREYIHVNTKTLTPKLVPELQVDLSSLLVPDLTDLGEYGMPSRSMVLHAVADSYGPHRLDVRDGFEAGELGGGEGHGMES
jgi:hypothetical protein